MTEGIRWKFSRTTKGNTALGFSGFSQIEERRVSSGKKGMVKKTWKSFFFNQSQLQSRYLNRICSFVENYSLWKVTGISDKGVQKSRRFRSLSIFQFRDTHSPLQWQPLSVPSFHTLAQSCNYFVPKLLQGMKHSSKRPDFWKSPYAYGNILSKQFSFWHSKLFCLLLGIVESSLQF
jgi:hypothetical protein